MKMIGFYIVAAGLEIVGCFSFWVWRRNGQSALWTIPGSIALFLFALTLTRIDTANAGRAYAAYGGVYIVASLVWLWCVEGVRPDSWDILGASLCLIGASVILFGPHRHLP